MKTKITAEMLEQILAGEDHIFEAQVKVKDVSYKTYAGNTTITLDTDSVEWGKIRMTGNAIAAVENRLGIVDALKGKTIVAKCKAFAPTSETGMNTAVILDVPNMSVSQDDMLRMATVNKMAKAFSVSSRPAPSFDAVDETEAEEATTKKKETSKDIA